MGNSFATFTSLLRASAVPLVAAFCAAVQASAEPLLVADFTGRTVNGMTASGITWTAHGFVDPGSLTAVENESNGVVDDKIQNGGLFDTPSARNSFALDLNVNNEDGCMSTFPSR